MKFDWFITETGWLRKSASFVLFLISLALMLFPWFLNIPGWLMLSLCLVGVGVGLINGYEGKAKQFGYAAPFTNDPLGWRNAKESYKTQEDPEDQATKDK